MKTIKDFIVNESNDNDFQPGDFVKCSLSDEPSHNSTIYGIFDIEENNKYRFFFLTKLKGNELFYPSWPKTKFESIVPADKKEIDKFKQLLKDNYGLKWNDKNNTFERIY